MKRKIVLVVEIVVILAAARLLGETLIPAEPPAREARDYFLLRGVEETGAANLVSAIYLRYRNYDTLGETMVLLLAVSGVTFLIGPKDRP